MDSTVRKTKPLNGFNLFNPVTGRYEVLNLTVEMDPFSRCTLEYRVDYEDMKGESSDGSTPS